MALIEVERDIATTEGLREEAPELGNVGFREGGRCCLIRRRPESPKPWSCSFMIGDLGLTVNQTVLYRRRSNLARTGFQKLQENEPK